MTATTRDATQSRAPRRLLGLALAGSLAAVGLPFLAGTAAAAPLGIDIKPPTKWHAIYDSTANGPQQGNTQLPKCEGPKQTSPNLDGRQSWAEWWIESEIGSGSVIPVGTEWKVSYRINAQSPDSKGNNGPFWVRVSWLPSGPIERVGAIEQEYQSIYNDGKNDTGIYTSWSGKMADDPFGIGFDANSRPNVLTTSDGAYVTASFTVRATEPGVITATGLDVRGHDDSGVPVVTVNKENVEFDCNMFALFTWTVVEPNPTVLPEHAVTDSRYNNTVAGDANTGPHTIRIDVLANDVDNNFPGDIGNTNRIRISDWSAASAQGGTVSCGTAQQKAVPASTAFDQLSVGPCSYTPAVGFAGNDSFTYTVRSGYTGGETVGVAYVTVRPNNRPSAVDVGFGTATGQDAAFDLAPGVGDVDGDPVICQTAGAVAPAIGEAIIAADCTLDWVNQSPGFTGNVSVPYRVCDTHPTLNAPDLGPVASRAPDYSTGDLSATTARRCRDAVATIAILPGLKLPPTGVTDIDKMDAWFSGDGHSATSLSIPVLANDFDGNGPAPTMPSAALAILTGPDPDAGTASVVGERIVFTAADGYFGPVGMTYRVCEDPAQQNPPYVDDPDTPLIDEGLPVCGVGQVIIGVFNNARPVATADKIEMLPTATITGFDVSANDVDPEGGVLACVPGALEVLTPAKITSASITSDCLLDVDPVDSATGIAQVRYRICDDHLLMDPAWEANPYAADGRGPGDAWNRCDTGLVNISLLWGLDQIVLPGGSNEPPVCVDDLIQTNQDVKVEIPVLANDTDDNEGLILAGPTEELPADSAQGGTFYADSDADPNTIVFTPKAGFSGTDTFAYVAFDIDGATCTATVTVTVLAASDPVPPPVDTTPPPVTPPPVDQTPPVVDQTPPVGIPQLPATGRSTSAAGLGLLLLLAGLGLSVLAARGRRTHLG
jgi:hypothetical protein